MSKVDRKIHGPGWGEVILGAILSLLLGIVLGALLLILKPVEIAKEMPKEPVPGTLYYVEGIRGDSSSARQALAKRKAFVEGQSVKLTEQELNALAQAAAPSTPAAKQEEKGQPTEPAKPAETVAIGIPNVRIRENVMQVGVPVTVNVLGLEHKVIAQARGGFTKQGNVFVYDPAEMYFGSCPVQRLPFLSDYIRKKLAGGQPIPEDIAAAWPKLANVSIEGNTLNLAMQ